MKRNLQISSEYLREIKRFLKKSTNSSSLTVPSTRRLQVTIIGCHLFVISQMICSWLQLHFIISVKILRTLNNESDMLNPIS